MLSWRRATAAITMRTHAAAEGRAVAAFRAQSAQELVEAVKQER